MKSFILLIIIFIFIGCAKPPLKEFLDAKSFLYTAENKAAKIYAKEEYEKAYNLVRMSESEINSKNYKKAVEIINKTKIKLEELIILTQKNKNRLRENISKDIEDIILLFYGIDEDKANKYALNTYNKAEELLNEAEEAFDIEDYALVNEKIALVNIKIKKILKYIEYGIENDKIKAEMELRERKRKEAEEKRIKREEFEKKFPSIHIVNNGETLWSLAKSKNIYNDPFQWPLIYKANRDQIKNPLIIYIGQALKIPRETTIEEIINARKEAGAPSPSLLPKDAYVPKNF